MRYMRQLDGLRALAILSVMLEHFGGKGLNRFIPIGAGNLGVNLFFTLSGFLITGILLASFTNAPSKRRAWADFYFRRFLRLAPIFYVTIIGLLLLGIGSIRESWPWHVSYLSNIYVAAGGEKTVFWSLAVEEQFYLIWPFVIAFAPRRHLVPITIALFVSGVAWKILGYYAGVPRQSLNVLLPGSFEPLAVGCLLGIFCFRRGSTNQFDWLTPGRERLLGSIALVSLLSAVSVWAILGRGSLARQFFIDGQMALAYGWVVIMAARGFSGPVGALLNTSTLNYIGRISYGLYVVHNWIPDVVEAYAGPLPKIAAAPIVLGMTFGLCALSYRYVEVPIRDWGHRFSSHRSREAAEETMPAG